jgi:hypothetical protein
LKLAIQEYDIDVYHIPGPDNIAADALSRLMNPSKTTVAFPLTRSVLIYRALEGEAEDTLYYNYS